MAYLTKEFYDNTFHGEPIADDEFVRLAEAASDVIDAVINVPVTDDTDKEGLARATAYQVEYIKQQGGISAVTGAAESQKVVTEKLEDYSYTEARTDAASQSMLTIGGIPVSPLAVAILRKLGLMARWYYSRRGCGRGN